MARTQVRRGYCYRRLNKISHLIYCEGLSWAELAQLKLRPLARRFKSVELVVRRTLRDPSVKLALTVAGVLAALVFGSGTLYFVVVEGMKRGL
jgi:hypothetical protein